MMRKQALNPDQKKKDGGLNDQIAQKSYNLTKFAEIMSDEDEDEESDDDFD